MAIAKRAQYYIYCSNKPAYSYKIDIITIIAFIADIITIIAFFADIITIIAFFADIITIIAFIADIIYIAIIKIYIYNYAFLLRP